MLRYKTQTRPGLVALYDIRPGNGAGPLLQLRSPHRVTYFTGLHTKWSTIRVHSILCYQSYKNSNVNI